MSPVGCCSSGKTLLCWELLMPGVVDLAMQLAGLPLNETLEPEVALVSVLMPPVALSLAGTVAWLQSSMERCWHRWMKDGSDRSAD